MSEASTDKPGRKVIVVAEAPTPGRLNSGDRRFDADAWDVAGDTIAIKRTSRADDPVIALYSPGSWLSVREGDAEVPDYAAQALDRARRALRDVAHLNTDDGMTVKDAQDIAQKAIADLFDLGFE